jgi:putative DNA primase/helicase
MTAQLRSWAARLGGEVSGNSVRVPGPGHSPVDRSLSVTPSASSPDGFVVHSFASDDPLRCKDHVRARLGLPGFSPSRAAKSLRIETRPEPHTKPVEDDEQRIRNALRLWDRAVNPRGTLVERYLNSRKLELPTEAANEAIRFHPDCPFGNERFPAMICLVRNISTDEPQGIHRTALTADGTAIKRGGKTFRVSLGPVGGGAIKVDPDEDVTQGLCVGEGVETCLAGRQMGLHPVWSAVNTGGVAKFPVLPGVDGLHIFKENDASGASARDVEACARRWYEAGRDVVIVEPDSAKDLNDELREAAR